MKNISVSRKCALKALYCALLALLMTVFLSFAVQAESYPESPHPYANNYEKTWSYTSAQNADYLAITFSDKTKMEVDDAITITDQTGNVWRYTGSALSDKTIYVQGNSFSISLKSDSLGTDYGFRITLVKPISAAEYSTLTPFSVSNSGTLNGYYGCDKTVVVPSVIDGITVNSISKDVFSGNTNIQSVTLPDTTIAILEKAFENCTALTSVNMQEGVRYIEWYAFHGCSSLKSISLPQSLIAIDHYTFMDCTLLATVRMPSSLEYFGAQVFDGCSALASIDIPAGLTEISDWTFHDCAALKNVTIPQSVTAIGEYAFYNCTSLQSVPLQEGLTTINTGAFFGCTALKSINIPQSVTGSIPQNAFYGCASLKSISIPKSVQIIGRDAFNGCAALSSVTLQKGLTEIGSFAFDGCDALTRLTVPETVSELGEKAFPPDCVLYVGNNNYLVRYAVAFLYDYVSSTGSHITGTESFTTVEEKAQWVIDTYITSSMSNYTKALTLYNWVCKNVTYDHAYLETDIPTSPLGVGKEAALLDGIAVCHGFAESYEYLMNMVGIPCKYVSGVADYNNGAHAWNLVYLNGGWYQCDPTWDAPDRGFGHRYFLLRDDAMEYDHTRDSYLGLRCEDYEMNYYFRIGAYDTPLVDLQSAINACLTAGQTSGTVEVSIDYQLNFADLYTIAAILSHNIQPASGELSVSVIPGDATKLRFAVEGASAVSEIYLTGYNPETVPYFDLPLGITLQLQAQTMPQNAAAITYASSNPSVVSVSSSGQLRALSVGTSYLTLTADKATLVVHVRVVENGMIHIKSDVTVLERNASTKIELASYYNYVIPYELLTIQWSSSNTSVATINSQGVARSLKDGPVTITANIQGIGTFSEEFYVSVLASGVSMRQQLIQAKVGDRIAVQSIPTFDETVSLERVKWSYIYWQCTDNGVLLQDELTSIYPHNGYREQEYTATGIGASLVTATYMDGSKAQGQCVVVVHADKALTLPASLKAIEAEAFAGVMAQEIVIPSGATSIGSRAFADMTALRLITIPTSVREIAPDAFAGTKNVAIICASGSPAAAFAEAHGILWFAE